MAELGSCVRRGFLCLPDLLNPRIPPPIWMWFARTYHSIIAQHSIGPSFFALLIVSRVPVSFHLTGRYSPLFALVFEVDSDLPLSSPNKKLS